MTKAPLSDTFVAYASDILAETQWGLSGPQIAKACAAFSIEFGIEIPHPTWPFSSDLPNKRTALAENLYRFNEAQRYAALKQLCDHQRVRELPDVKKLKLTLVGRYGHLAGEALATDVDQADLERTLHWLGPFPTALAPYQQAIEKHANGMFLRNVLDDLRLSLELLVRAVLKNEKSLENQVPLLGAFIKSSGGSAELSNMYVKLIDYYTKYQNTYVKHDDAVIDDEVEFILELTSTFMRHLVRLSYKIAV